MDLAQGVHLGVLQLLLLRVGIRHAGPVGGHGLFCLERRGEMEAAQRCGIGWEPPPCAGPTLCVRSALSPRGSGLPYAGTPRSKKVPAKQCSELLGSHLVLGLLLQPPLLVQGFGGDAAGGALLLLLCFHCHIFGLIVLLAALHVHLLGLPQVHLRVLLPTEQQRGEG